MTEFRTLLSCLLTYAAIATLVQSNFAPFSWATTAFCTWLLFALSKGWTALQRSDKYHLAWGWGSVAAFITFLQIYDRNFKGWADVYYFCGTELQYCNCDLRWNFAGWMKAAVLWSFVLSTSLALQKLVIQAGLKGLLPGEEVVTKESFISICWRLIPYWLNKWEQQWGAECSSMMFELPHFAMELLVVLPCVQVLCSRMRILALPAGRNLRPNMVHLPPRIREDPAQMAMLSPSIIHGVWRPVPHQDCLLPRIRTNLRMLLIILGIIVLASFNAMYVPLNLERQIFKHPRSAAITSAAEICGASADCWAIMDLGSDSAALKATHSAACPSHDPLTRVFRKHGAELLKMKSAQHTELIPLVETGLAVMRLSCERFFVLISVFVGYLAFHTQLPPWFRLLIRVNHRLSKMFQQVILFSFPAVCWIYGAGVVFSTFVSLLFWGAPARRIYENLRKIASVVQPLGLQDATAEQIERMNGNCAVCWSEMCVVAVTQQEQAVNCQPGKALPCGHAFHHSCIQRWLRQCHGQGRQPTCPLCNRTILLQVRYRLPFPLHQRAPQDPLDEPADVAEPGEMEPREDEEELQNEVRHGGEEAGGPEEEPTHRAPEGPQFSVPPLPLPSTSEGAPHCPRAGRPVRKWRCSSEQEEGGDHAASTCSGGQLIGPETQAGEATARSAPTWNNGPAMPVLITPGAVPREGRPKNRHKTSSRARPSEQQAENYSSCPTSSAQAPTTACPPDACASGNDTERPSTSAQYQFGTSRIGVTDAAAPCQPLPPLADRGEADVGWRGPARGDLDRSAAVRRDHQRARAYLDFCRAQEAQFYAKIEHCTGVMMEAWQTARELLKNAEQLELLNNGSQTQSSLSEAALQAPSHEGGLIPSDRQTTEEQFTALWRRQQQLWQRSQELHQEGGNYMQP